jgi:RNA polymerase sigma factor (TIGR02999 family)
MCMSAGDATRLLRAWSEGEGDALEQLIPLVEAELRHVARAYMARERPDHTLQTTALLNEAFIRLVDARETRWQDRAHFVGIAARLMRRVLIDHARSRGYQKRGGGNVKVSLTDDIAIESEPEIWLIALDQALEKLSKDDERKAKVIELRFFGGLTVEETAEVLSLSPDTIMRDWRLAKLWLVRELEGQHL